MPSNAAVMTEDFPPWSIVLIVLACVGILLVAAFIALWWQTTRSSATHLCIPIGL